MAFAHSTLRDAVWHPSSEHPAFNDGVKLRTADFLGINRNTLNKKVKELGVE